MESINHKRLDAVLSQAPHVDAEKNCASEFEGLRRSQKMSMTQVRRMKHLEKHLDAGDVICDCYETLRPI